MSKIFSILLILVNLSAAGQKVIIRDSVTGQRYWLSVGALPVGSATTARLSDTAAAIRGSIPSVSGKLNITDTAGMLSGYSRGTHTHAYATITGTPTIPTNTNQLTNGAGFLSSYAGQTNYTAYGTGTAYTLTATSAAVTFGTTSPAITITSAGTYMIYYDVQTNYNGATFAASRTISYKLRRTNNTPADLTSSTISFATQIITTLTFSPTQKQRMIIYTASAGDIIQLWGSVSVLPTAGSAQVNDASIIAVKQY